MKKKILFISSIVLFFLITCTNEKGPVPIVQTTNPGDCDTAYWYTGIIEPIIIASCNSNAACHGAGGLAPVHYDTYAGVKSDVDNGTFKQQVCVDKIMPKPGFGIPPLSAAQLDRINCWLQHGAPNTGTIATTTTTCPTIISYSVIIAPLVATNCAVPGCHAAGSINGDYTSYAGLKIDADNGKLNNRVIVLKNMHKFPNNLIPPLPDADVSNIDCWIKQLSPNN